jgi:hypothetical protein
MYRSVNRDVTLEVRLNWVYQTRRREKIQTLKDIREDLSYSMVIDGMWRLNA